MLSSEFVTGPPNQGTATLHQVNHVRRIQMPARPRALVPANSFYPFSFSLTWYLALALTPPPPSAPGPPPQHHTLFGRRLNLGTV